MPRRLSIWLIFDLTYIAAKKMYSQYVHAIQTKTSCQEIPL